MNVLNKVAAIFLPDRPEFDVTLICEQIWYDIFLRCNLTTLISLGQTCSHFRKLLSAANFWLEKCEYDGISLPPLEWRRFVRNDEAPGTASSAKSFDARRIAFKNPYNRNLAIEIVPNANLEQLERKYAIQFYGGGHHEGFRVESPPTYAAEHPDIHACIATSYYWCERYFEIDLVKEGVEEWILDDIRPVINVSEMFICRRDCGALYEIYVQLLLKDEMFDRMAVLPRLQRHEKSWVQWEGGLEWEKKEFQFKEYPRGIRRVAVLTRGKDSQFWAGHYGPKFGNTRVVVEFPEDIRYKADDEFADPEKQYLGDPMPRGPRSLRIPVGVRGRARQGRFRFN